MDLNGIGRQEAIGPERSGDEAARKADLRLKDACGQFEGMLLGILLKESLSGEGAGAGEDSAAGFDQFREFCAEQVATSLSETASMGIADQLYQQMSMEGRKP